MLTDDEKQEHAARDARMLYALREIERLQDEVTEMVLSGKVRERHNLEQALAVICNAAANRATLTINLFESGANSCN